MHDAQRELRPVRLVCVTSPEETDPRHTPGEASLWVEALARGDPGAESQLLDLVYAELRRLANSFLQHVPLATEFAESIRGDGAEVWTQIGLLTLDEGLEVLA